MDPESATLQVKLIESRGQSILGWYHSHPKFEVNPSHIDVLNHETYQNMFNEANQHFFGLIISPYYSVSTDSAPHLNALPKLRVFHTVKDSASGRIVPYEL